MGSSGGIDIIIPIYNAYEDCVECVESIRKWTDLNKHRLILVNDCSTDARVRPFLDSLKNENCIVVHNEENRGFSANINLGMAQSEERDVILLNSDTAVTKNWVEKLQACAYRDPWTATATPLSNNATLCSVPHFCRENRLPEGYTADEYAELVERASLKRYPEIPVAHGFCMFIKREVISLIGNFDAETFEKGYGEENDFCCRAIEMGYHHVMCDDTFILHTGTCSFISKDKKKYMAEHEKILEKNYPELMQEVRIHCRDNPTSIITRNIQLHMELDESRNRKTVMYLLQSDFRENASDNVGGTQLHVKDLVCGLRRKYNLVVAARNYDYLNVTFYMPEKELFFRFFIGAKKKFRVFRSSEFAELYGNILDAFSVDLVHIHHPADLSLELYYEAEKRQIPVFTSLHDYYYVCPNIILLDENNRLCAADGRADCRRCLMAQKGISQTVGFMDEWRKQHGRVLQMSEKIIIPSESAKHTVAYYYPEIEKKMMVIEHGSGRVQIKKEEKTGSGKQSFHVAFLGAVNVAKGFRTAVELIQKGSSIDWYLFGYFERAVPELDKKENFHNMGAYQREELPELMKQHEIDLACILPICSETFCYTLSEAVMCGVPVLAADTGALGERVRKMDCGWVVPDRASGDEILARIVYLMNHREAYEEKLHCVRQVRLKSAEEMCSEYDLLYQKEIEGTEKRNEKAETDWLIKGYLMQDMEQKDPLVEFQDRLAEAERQLYEISRSFSYRLALRVVKFPIPFRTQIKKLFIHFHK